MENVLKFFHLGFEKKCYLRALNTSTATAISTHVSFNLQERRQFGQYSDCATNCKPSNRGSIPNRGKRSFSPPKHTDHPWGPSILLFDGYRQRLSGGKATEA